MTTDTTKLRAAAQRVIEEGGNGWFCEEQVLREEVTGEFEPELSPLPQTDMAYIAACSPEAILAILDELDAQRQQNTGLLDQHTRDSKMLREYAQARDDARKERDTFRAALQAAVDCGMVPKSSASDSGASCYSEQARAADQIRAALSGESK